VALPIWIPRLAAASGTENPRVSNGPVPGWLRAAFRRLPRSSRRTRSSPSVARKLALELFFVGIRAQLGFTALQELPRLAGGRALARIGPDFGLQLDDVDELVGLPAQLLGGHRRLRRGGGDHGDAHAASLHRLDQRAKIPVAGEQN